MTIYPMYVERELPKYEYEILTITPGSQVYLSDLSRLGSEGYRLVQVLPIIGLEIVDGERKNVADGSQLIFERIKINDN